MIMQENIDNIFADDELDTLAREHRFIVRSTNRIQATDFVDLMTIQLCQDPELSLDGMCDVLESKMSNTRISGQGLQQRINSIGAVDFLSAVFGQCLSQAVNPFFNQTPPQLLTPFRRILLQDSTQIKLNDALCDAFCGCGGSSGKAALKLHLIYDYHRHQISEVSITNATTSDTEMGQGLVEKIQADDLVMRDLGYFSIHQLREIDGKQAFFLSRLPSSVGVYLDRAPEAEAIDIIEYINRHFPHQDTIEIQVYLGAEKFPVRLIAYRLPEKMVNQRRRKAYDAARKKSRRPTKKYLQWLSFSFYITNVPVTVWTTAVIGTIYRLRWQIELIFKQWKSLLKIDFLTGKSEYRIECLIYGRLITICLYTLIYGVVWWYAMQEFNREVSCDKLIKWLGRNNRLAKLLKPQSFASLFLELIQQINHLLKEKRNRKTTYQRIRSGQTFKENFSLDTDDFLPKVA
ncbi:IS4 family transposase [bacterium]|nr:IS4 family transposase [bacterium]